MKVYIFRIGKRNNSCLRQNIVKFISEKNKFKKDYLLNYGINVCMCLNVHNDLHKTPVKKLVFDMKILSGLVVTIL